MRKVNKLISSFGGLSALGVQVVKGLQDKEGMASGDNSSEQVVVCAAEPSNILALPSDLTEPRFYDRSERRRYQEKDWDKKRRFVGDHEYRK